MYILASDHSSHTAPDAHTVVVAVAVAVAEAVGVVVVAEAVGEEAA